MGKKSKKPPTFPASLKTFLGYLEGTEKSAHTIKNYMFDLVTFQKFLEHETGKRAGVLLSDLQREDLERYYDWLKAQGLKTNTRRRKFLTVRKLFRFLAQRNKLDVDIGRRLQAPDKLERIPFTVPLVELLTKIQALPIDTDHHARNRLILWTLAETGCQVSEVSRLRIDQWALGERHPLLSFEGKAPRVIPISAELFRETQALWKRQGESEKQKPWIFPGHNKFGPLSGPITSRGVELLVRSYAGELGYPEMVPRTFRHSAVLHWHQLGISREEIQRRLGLKTDYAFRIYEPLFKSNSKTTSNGEMNPQES